VVVEVGTVLRPLSEESHQTRTQSKAGDGVHESPDVARLPVRVVEDELVRDELDRGAKIRETGEA
jgi:hypothetical protein